MRQLVLHLGFHLVLGLVETRRLARRQCLAEFIDMTLIDAQQFFLNSQAFLNTWAAETELVRYAAV